MAKEKFEDALINFPDKLLKRYKSGKLIMDLGGHLCAPAGSFLYNDPAFKKHWDRDVFFRYIFEDSFHIRLEMAVISRIVAKEDSSKIKQLMAKGDFEGL